MGPEYFTEKVTEFADFVNVLKLGIVIFFIILNGWEVWIFLVHFVIGIFDLVQFGDISVIAVVLAQNIYKVGELSDFLCEVLWLLLEQIPFFEVQFFFLVNFLNTFVVALFDALLLFSYQFFHL